MRFHSLFLPILLTASFSISGATFGLFNQQAQAQNAVDIPVIPPTTSTPPASTYNPGPWQPIARINPSQPVTVNIINQTRNTLEVGLTTGKTNTQIQPSGTAKINIPSLTSDIVINSVTGAAILDYQIETDENLVIVTVKTGSGVAGDNTINIHSNGGIYIY